MPCKISGQIHGDLSWKNEVFGSFIVFKLINIDLENVHTQQLDHFNANDLGCFLQHILKD